MAETHTMRGRSASEEVVVTAVEPGRGTTVEPSTFQRLTWRLFGAWGLRVTAKAMRQDLADITAAAERGGT